MRGSLKVGRAVGIDIFVHWSFILAPAFVVYQSWSSGSWQIVTMALIILFSIFGCVLLHEYGHALMARRLGVATRDIVLTPIGGLARLEGMPRTPKHEFLITIAGPLVNLALALLALVYLGITGQPIDQPQRLQDFALIFFWMNLILFSFNLLPAFPMDGGRILRSTLACFMTHETATSIAGILGKLFAIGFIVYGFRKPQYGLILVGGFIYFSAMNEMAVSRFYARRNAAQTDVEQRSTNHQISNDQASNDQP